MREAVEVVGFFGSAEQGGRAMGWDGERTVDAADDSQTKKPKSAVTKE